MNSKELGERIHDKIQNFHIESNINAISNLLDIMQMMNERMDAIERTARNANNIAGCLANGIQPD